MKSTYRFNRSLIVVVLVSIAVLLSGCASNGASETGQKGIARLKQENALLRRQITLMRRQQQLAANQRQPVFRSRAAEVQFGDKPAFGNAGATLAMIEFSDYFCPYCKRFHATTFDLIKKNFIDNGKLLYVYRDFPRGGAKRAVAAAVAANCAGEQGAYLKMQKTIFRNAPRINAAFYKTTAKELGLNLKKYETCLNSEQHRQQVIRDFVYGQSLGVRGTPTFYIGRVEGKKITAVQTIVGARPYQKFSQTIERSLQSTRKP